MKHFFLFLLCGLWIAPALAQDEVYAPPPMFDAPAMNTQPDETPAHPALNKFKARISRVKPADQPKAEAIAPADKYTGANNPLLPPVITKNDPVLKNAAPKKPVAAKPPPPPQKPQMATQQVSVPAIEKPAPAPVAAPAAPKVETPKIEAPKVAKPNKPAVMPAARVTSKGIVTGPKTMPSVPTTAVTAETVFEEPSAGTKTLMERHQETKKIAEAPPPASEAHQKVEAAGPQAVSVVFEKGVTDTKNPPLSALVNALKADMETRVLIEAYGNATDEGENSDKRIALARALNLRKIMIGQQIDSHRIDIRALGQQAAQGSKDRVDLTLYKPQKTAN